MKALKILTQICSWIVVPLLLSTACSDDSGLFLIDNNNEEIVIQIPLSISGADKVTSSRAPDNNTVNDLYVLIFNAAGEVKGRQYYSRTELITSPTGSQPNTTGVNNWVTIDTRKGLSYIYGFANLDGTTDLYSGSLKEQLDAISNRTELLNLSLSLTEDVSRIGSTYLMSGKLEEYNISDTSIRTLPLRRVDAAFTFKISTGGNCTNFTLSSYQLINVPRKSYLVERASTRAIGLDATWDATSQAEDFFNTPEITGLLNATDGFQFYLTENRANGIKEIKGATEKEIYGKREKQVKNPIEDGYVENGAYEYAPAYGTYIVLKGYFTGNSTVPDNIGAVEASVQYIIHLGYAEGTTEERANDFFVSRNTDYTYLVKIMGVNDIIIEVISETETENSPGAEGDVIFTQGTTRFNLDSHYETVLLRFSRDLLERGDDQLSEFFTYRVITPFTKLGSNITDESWIRVTRNSKEDGLYSTELDSYPGNNPNNYLTIAGLIDELKRHASITGYFDNNNEVIYTCHIDEFYYDTAPANTPTLSGNLWRHFTNVPNRELHILTDVELSPDKQSSITRSAYILSQRAIQTFFDTTTEEIYSAYGVECINETGPLHGWQAYKNQIGVYNITDENTGQTNYRKIVTGLTSKSSGNKWETYLDWSINGYKEASADVATINAMRVTSTTADYNKAYLGCLQRNRDLNGNEIIDTDEIKWYLPALNQYAGMFIGDAGLSEEAKLYTENTYIYKHFVTSTTRNTSTTDSENNLMVYWAEESASISCNTEYDMVTGTNARILNHYRCMRNLGSGTPVLYYDVNGESITTPYLNKGSYRSTLTSGELGKHTNWEDGSRLSTNGFNYLAGTTTNFRPASTVGAAMAYEVTTGNSNTACYSITPVGTWRAPNVREFYLLRSAGVLLTGDVSRTIFKFHDVNIPLTSGATTSTTYRIGWHFNGSNITMGNGTVGEGSRIRCVRDNN